MRRSPQELKPSADEEVCRVFARHSLELEMNELASLEFDQANISDRIEELDDSELDTLDFGVIGFDPSTAVRRYNAFESREAGLAPLRVLGFALFTAVAPCMNNVLVARRFEDAAASATLLDATINYVFMLRIRQVKVTLRLLASRKLALRYVLVNRRT
jgi:photoactive yellow protein